MAEWNLLSSWGAVAVGGPLLLLGVVLLAASATAYAIRRVRRGDPWRSDVVRSFLLLGCLSCVVGVTIAGSSLMRLLVSL